jgi:CheY-like chemotaxis protein
MLLREPPASDILLVEDDDSLGVILTAVLQDQGYTVARASNGKEALDYLGSDRPPRLILLNLMMPVMNGWKLRDYLKQDPALAQIPVVVLSGVCNLEKKAAALEAADTFTKPYNLKALIETVRQYCGPGKPANAVAATCR